MTGATCLTGSLIYRNTLRIRLHLYLYFGPTHTPSIFISYCRAEYRSDLATNSKTYVRRHHHHWLSRLSPSGRSSRPIISAIRVVRSSDVGPLGVWGPLLWLERWGNWLAGRRAFKKQCLAQTAGSFVFAPISFSSPFTHTAVVCGNSISFLFDGSPRLTYSPLFSSRHVMSYLPFYHRFARLIVCSGAFER